MNKKIEDAIEKYVKETFNGLRLNLLGSEGINKAFAFSLKKLKYDPQTTLDSMFYVANSANNPDLKDIQTLKDSEVLERIKKVSDQYIAQLEEKTIADVKAAVSSYYNDAHLQAQIENKSIEEVLQEKRDILESLQERLNEIKDRINRSVQVLVDNEIHTAQNYGAMEGIIAAAKAIGIEDPTVCKLGVLDDVRCKHCWRLWTLPDKVTPKVYKLSELQASPGHWKNPAASLSPTHPNCRDVLITIMPGFGFDGNGKIVYKGKDPSTGELWDEYKHQKSKEVDLA